MTHHPSYLDRAEATASRALRVASVTSAQRRPAQICGMSTLAGSVSNLPPPTSGLFLEISFRRLLKSCVEIITGDNKGREDLTMWQRSPVFHHVWS